MPRRENTKIAWGDAKESKPIIIEAAAQCFERYGPQRTSMDDIAEAAGISRKTLYRVFSDRPKLIQAVLESRWAKLSKRVQRRIAKATSFREALLEGSLTAITDVRKDKLAHDIIHKATDHTLEQFLIRGNVRTHKASLDVWQAAIDMGRQEGVIKPHLTDDRIMEIIVSIFAILIMLDEKPARQREYLEDVLLPSIMTEEKIKAG